MLSHQYNKSWSRISIHAPLAGSDIPSLNNLFKLLLFLSTLPSRGATRKLAGLIRYLPNFYPRSPRGERHTARGRKADILYFYPRSPRGERHRGQDGRQMRMEFLSTLPSRGATGTSSRAAQAGGISIHAPLAGSDTISVCSIPTKSDFYPRSPRGERRWPLWLGGVLGVFLSTLPSRGATAAM